MLGDNGCWGTCYRLGLMGDGVVGDRTQEKHIHISTARLGKSRASFGLVEFI